MRDRAPVVDYRCRECGAVFNLFTGTVWAGTHYSCAKIVLILRGFVQGTPTLPLADELECDYGTLLDYRHQMQAAALLGVDRSPLADAVTEGDELFQNAGEKGDPHCDPADPPRRRANQRRGRGTMANDRPPIQGVVGRASGEIRLTVCDDTRQATVQPETMPLPAPVVQSEARLPAQVVTQPSQQVYYEPEVMPTERPMTPARVITQTPVQRPAAVRTPAISRAPAQALPALPPINTQPAPAYSGSDLRLPPLPTRVTAQAAKPAGEARAETLLESGKKAEAVSLLQSILEKNPDSPRAHFLMGKALSLEGDLFASIKHLEEAIRVDDKFYDAYFLLGRNYARVNLLEDALRNYQIYYGVKPQATVAGL